MAQKEIEVILARQLASYLSMSIFIVDPEGNLLFYNEPAERILGRRYQETGEMPASEWSTIFEPTDEEDNPIAPDDLPLMIALTKRRPAHGAFWIRGLDDVSRKIEVVAIPLMGQSERYVGAMSIFWEVEE